jgi:hypothetical protein
MTRSAERTSSQLSTGSSGSASSFPSTAAPEAMNSETRKKIHHPEVKWNVI